MVSAGDAPDVGIEIMTIVTECYFPPYGLLRTRRQDTLQA
jgi:hypothetical protein